MISKGVTLRGLEVFEALASTGSVAQAAAVTGLSQPAVSQQLRNLETALDTDLIDHGKRPMRLTPAGHSFLGRTEAALAQLRLAQSELAVMDLAHLSTLSIGLIDDFDNDLTPRLVTILADSLTHCKFKLITAPSHKILEDIADKKLHLAIAASAGTVMDGVLEYPLARDPFILVAPKGTVKGGGDVMAQLGNLPFLRYEKNQLIGRLIEAHLARQKLDLPERFEIGSHLALMAMVARRIGWAVTTPLGYMRAVRFHDEVDAFTLPFKPFARTISLFAGADWVGEVPASVAQTMRRLIDAHMITPALAQLPWLAGDLRVLDG
ncbi:transcriptional regulator, LysR family [Pseudosulfitobacter pseudonitzschiae]|uniref:LysR family transcriptional regulator n=1 Tax=Pseudosulfitobacter pseudonitzschiae TaxID=1402135 RepID=A0A073J2U3_9RHOB|nr:LysR family transcriptional regulator [Pseudosulfitobacter pseudonitzschiae]KEJ96145.1 LysR family transcriptional regulator [Pseudosulfitobacter pseudonitzschiae]QKS10687.1 LysR family transcriptional regulator [Pseudosulfitobacter pseudonitzschiae]SHE98743.1 transcriptional regulator, LysR family [Pseudosulfitobacter pseudonitzschiae]